MKIALACFLHGLFPFLCLTRGSDTIRALHHRMVSHRVVQHSGRPVAPSPLKVVVAGD